MDRRWLVVVALLVVLLSAGPLVASAGGGNQLPDENAVVVSVNPSSTDLVTLYFPVDDTDDPRARAKRLAAEAELPVYDISNETVRDQVITYVNGEPVDGQRYHQTRIETDVDERTGTLERQIPHETVSAVAPTHSPNVTVATLKGTAVTPAESRPLGLWSQRYDVSSRYEAVGDAITYRFPATGLLAILVLVIGSFVAPFLLVRYLARPVPATDWTTARKVQKLRRIEVLSREGTIGIAVVIAVSLGAPSLTRFLGGSVMPMSVTDSWWSVSLWFAALAPFVGLPWLATSLANLPLYRDLRVSEEARRSFLSDWLKLFAYRAGSFWVAAVVVATYWSQIVGTPAIGAIVVGTLVLLNEAIAPSLIRLLNDVRPITDDQREDIDAMCAEEGITIQEIYRLDTGDSREANGIAAGVLGRHRIFLTDDLLDEFDAAETRAIVAHELGHVKHRHLVKRALFAMAFWFVVLHLNAVIFESWLFLGVMLCLYTFVGLGYLTHQQEFTADAYAASITGTETIVAALERLSSVNTIPRTTGPLFDLAGRHPSIDDRIESVRERAERTEDESA